MRDTIEFGDMRFKKEFIDNFSEGQIRIMKVCYNMVIKKEEQYEKKFLKMKEDLMGTFKNTESLVNDGWGLVFKEGIKRYMFYKDIEILIDKYSNGTMIHNLPKTKQLTIKGVLQVRCKEGMLRGAGLVDKQGCSIDLFHINGSSVCCGGDIELRELLAGDKIVDHTNLKKVYERIKDTMSIVNPGSPYNFEERFKTTFRYCEQKYNENRRAEADEDSCSHCGEHIHDC